MVTFLTTTASGVDHSPGTKDSPHCFCVSMFVIMMIGFGGGNDFCYHPSIHTSSIYVRIHAAYVHCLHNGCFALNCGSTTVAVKG